MLQIFTTQRRSNLSQTCCSLRGRQPLETGPHIHGITLATEWVHILICPQGHPLGCAVALAIQDVIESENLLENVNIQGKYLGTFSLTVSTSDSDPDKIKAQLLCEGLQGPNAIAAPFTFDIRGGGLLWGIEFDFASANHVDFKGNAFAMRVYARALQNGLIIMSFTGGANIEGTKGDHCMLTPAYNVTKAEIETIAAIFIRSVEEALREVSAV